MEKLNNIDNLIRQTTQVLEKSKAELADLHSQLSSVDYYDNPEQRRGEILRSIDYLDNRIKKLEQQLKDHLANKIKVLKVVNKGKKLNIFISLSLLSIFAALTASFFAGHNSELGFERLSVRFCPVTANKPGTRYTTKRKIKVKDRPTRFFDTYRTIEKEAYISNDEFESSQFNLDRKDQCSIRKIVLRDVWEKEILKRGRELPESVITELQPRQNTNHQLYLLTPVLFGVGILFYKKYVSTLETNRFVFLEAYKEDLRITSFVNNLDYDYKAELLMQDDSSRKLAMGLVSLESLIKQQSLKEKIDTAKYDLAYQELNTNRFELEAKQYEHMEKIEKAKKRIQKVTNKSVTAVANIQELKENFLEELKKYDILYRIIKSSKNIWIDGEAGSGKTELQVIIAYLRDLYFKVEDILVLDQHGHKIENYERWSQLPAEKTNVVASIDDILDFMYESKEMAIDRMPASKEEKSKIKSKIVLADEFTDLIKDDSYQGKYYEQLYDGTKNTPANKIITAFQFTITQHFRKAYIQFIGITHNFTNASMGDSTGKMRESSTIYLTRFADENQKPLPTVRLNYGLTRPAVSPDGKNIQEQITEHCFDLPKWFKLSHIVEYFNGNESILDMIDSVDNT